VASAAELIQLGNLLFAGWGPSDLRCCLGISCTNWWRLTLPYRLGRSASRSCRRRRSSAGST